MSQAPKKSPDWDRIEVDYRAGMKTLREIADEHNITEGAIRKRAKRDGWERDLAAKVRAKAPAVAYYVPNMRVEERMLHDMFSGKAVRGEWFALSEEDLRQIAGRSLLGVAA